MQISLSLIKRSREVDGTMFKQILSELVLIRKELQRIAGALESNDKAVSRERVREIVRQSCEEPVPQPVVKLSHSPIFPYKEKQTD